MLNPLIRWEPGTTVRYHGSLTGLHGTYQAYPCTCLNCGDHGLGATRFQLVDSAGKVIVSCVRARSITASLPAWEESTAEAARYDRYHFDRDEDE